MKLIKLNCQNCNGMLEVDIDNLIAYCPYCGQKLLFGVEQMNAILKEKEKTKRAQEITKKEQEKTKRSEEATKRLEMEHRYKEREDKRNNKKDVVALIGAIAFIFVVISLMFFMSEREKQQHLKDGEIKISFSADEIIGDNYNSIVKILKNDGFENIELIKADDLIVGVISKENTVKSISVNGDSDFSEGTWFPKDAIITITYHTF